MSDYTSKSALIEDIKRRPYIDKALEEIFFTIIDNQPTLDEKEIIRKAFERVVERLEELEEDNTADWQRFHCDDDFGRACAFEQAIKIVKEECGINE